MTRPDPMPRSFSSDRLNAALREVGGTARPGYVDDIVTQASRTRQRPAWTFPERWFLMTVAYPLRLARPRLMLGLGLVIMLLALVLIGATLLSVGVSPPPTREVRNGLIAFDSKGDIWVANPDGTEPRT